MALETEAPGRALGTCNVGSEQRPHRQEKQCVSPARPPGSEAERDQGSGLFAVGLLSTADLLGELRSVRILVKAAFISAKIRNIECITLPSKGLGRG